MAAKTTRPRVRARSSPELELPRWRKDVKILKGFFRSYLWKYPVHAFIGEVVKGQPSCHSTIECMHAIYVLSLQKPA